MFSVISLCHSVHRRDPMWPLPMMHWFSLYRAPWTSDLGTRPTLPPPLYSSNIWWWSLDTCSNLFIWGPPQLVTSGGCHWKWSTYSVQAGGSDPTGMLSCLFNMFFIQLDTSSCSSWVLIKPHKWIFHGIIIESLCWILSGKQWQQPSVARRNWTTLENSHHPAI